MGVPSEQAILIRVSDSGKGFDPETRQLEQEPGHLGLFFYRECIRTLKGQFEITSSAKMGTTITIIVPPSS